MIWSLVLIITGATVTVALRSPRLVIPPQLELTEVSILRGGSSWNSNENWQHAPNQSGDEQTNLDDETWENDEEDDDEDDDDDDEDAEAARAARRWTRRAFTLAQRGRLDQAAMAFEKAVRATPEDAPYRAALLIQAGSFLAFSGKPREALVPLREALTLAPDDARALHALGNALHQCDASKEALEVYTQALVKSPEQDFPPNAPLLNNVATILLTMGERNLARLSLERSLNIEPNAPGTLFNLAMAVYTDAHDGAVRRFYGDLGEDTLDDDGERLDDDDAGDRSDADEVVRARLAEEHLMVDLDQSQTKLRRRKLGLDRPLFEPPAPRPAAAAAPQTKSSSSSQSETTTGGNRRFSAPPAQPQRGFFGQAEKETNRRPKPRPPGAVAARRTVVVNETEMKVNMDTRVMSMSRSKVRGDANSQREMRYVIELLDRAEPHAPSGSPLRERILALRGVAAARIPGREKDAVKDLEDVLRHGSEHARDKSSRATALLELADVVPDDDRKLTVLKQAIQLLDDSRGQQKSSKGISSNVPNLAAAAASASSAAASKKQSAPPSTRNFLLGGKYRTRPSPEASDLPGPPAANQSNILGKTDAGSIVFRKRTKQDTLVALRATARAQLAALHCDHDDLDVAFDTYFAAAQDGLRGCADLYDSDAGGKLKKYNPTKFKDLLAKVAHNDALSCINAIANAFTIDNESSEPSSSGRTTSSS